MRLILVALQLCGVCAMAQSSPYARLLPYPCHKVKSAMSALTPDKLLDILPSDASAADIRAQTITSIDSWENGEHNSSARDAQLVAFWRLRVESSVPLDSFAAWAAPWYDDMLTALQLGDVMQRTPLERFRRVVVFGMYAIHAILQPKGLARLNHFALIDPATHVHYSGLMPRTASSPANKTRRLEASTVPASFDMRSHTGFPLEVKNQGACGACWAYTCAATLSIQNLYNTDAYRDISEQAFIACDVLTLNAKGVNTNLNWNQGCAGGEPWYAWEWARLRGGVPIAARYPDIDYTSGNAPTSAACAKALLSPVAIAPHAPPAFLPTASPTSSASDVLAVELAIIQQVAAGRPVTLQVAAGSPCFQTYSPDPTLSPIEAMLTCACPDSDPVDHTLLVVGYAPEYFVVRNQWGPFWGVNGYAYLPRRSANPGLNLSANGQCRMYFGPLYLPAVMQFSLPPTRKPTAPTPSKPPTAYPSRRPTIPMPTRRPATVAPSHRPTSVAPTLQPSSKRPTTHRPSLQPTNECPTAAPMRCTNPSRCCYYGCPIVNGVPFCPTYMGKICCANGKCGKTFLDKKGIPRVTCAK